MRQAKYKVLRVQCVEIFRIFLFLRTTSLRSKALAWLSVRWTRLLHKRIKASGFVQCFKFLKMIEIKRLSHACVPGKGVSKRVSFSSSRIQALAFVAERCHRICATAIATVPVATAIVVSIVAIAITYTQACRKPPRRQPTERLTTDYNTTWRNEPAHWLL